MLKEPIRSVVTLLHQIRRGDHEILMSKDKASELITALENMETEVSGQVEVRIPAMDDPHDDRPRSKRMLDMGHVFEQDQRKENPGLHMLYTCTAVEHLRLIDNSIRRMWDTSNLNMHDMIGAMQEQRDKLVNTNAAYAQADAILHSLKLTQQVYIVDASSGNPVN